MNPNSALSAWQLAIMAVVPVAALAAWLKDRLSAELGPEYAVACDLLSEAREAIRATGQSSEDLNWRRALDSGMVELIRNGRTAEAKELLQQCLSSSSG